MERSLAQVALGFSGIPLRRYRIEELMEQEVKVRKQDVAQIFAQLYAADPEFQREVKAWAKEEGRKSREDPGIRVLEESQ